MIKSAYASRGILIRLIYLITAACWFCLTLGGRMNRKKVVVLCYHGITDIQSIQFKWQMKKIANRAIVLDSINNESNNLFNKVCVTFDDAYENILKNALPVLQELKIPAVIFTVAGNFGDRPRWDMPDGHPEADEITMTAEQLVNLSKHPLVTIGSHTVTHPDLVKLAPDQIQTELVQSKNILEQLLDCPIEDLALPHGSYNQKVLSLAQKVGYKRIFTLDPKPADLYSGNPIIGRFSMSPDVWKVEYILTCAGAYAWLYHLRRMVNCFRQ